MCKNSPDTTILGSRTASAWTQLARLLGVLSIGFVLAGSSACNANPTPHPAGEDSSSSVGEGGGGQDSSSGWDSGPDATAGGPAADAGAPGEHDAASGVDATDAEADDAGPVLDAEVPDSLGGPERAVDDDDGEQTEDA